MRLVHRLPTRKRSEKLLQVGFRLQRHRVRGLCSGNDVLHRKIEPQLSVLPMHLVWGSKGQT
uniref:Uncharacterized protein n=1 Tax=Ciona savignyi TaxID=51511 RepID=H2YSU6_CIOSA